MLKPLVLEIFRLWLISKFMTLQTGQQLITIHNYPVSQEVKATRQCNLVS